MNLSFSIDHPLLRLPENLVFQGGGIKGLAYLGVLEVLENRKLLGDLKRVAGTSAGAITSTLLAIGYKSKQIRKLLTPKRFRSFKDGGFLFFQYEGEVFRKWLDNEIERQTGYRYCTFKKLRELHHLDPDKYKHLHVIATKLEGANSSIIDFNSEDEECDDVIISDAVRASMSIPLFFKPHQVCKIQEIFCYQCNKVVAERSTANNLGNFYDGGIF